MRKISKAVFPVAGMGTRFLPATKASPEEMLPIVDKPLIQFAVEEAIAAGISELIFVTSRNKRVIEDHFDSSLELEAELEARQHAVLLQAIRGIKPNHVQCVYVRQPQAMGLGHTLLCAERLLQNEPFAILYADDLIDAEVPVMQQMVRLYSHYGSSILGTEAIALERSSAYDIIEGRPVADRLLKLDGIINKPTPRHAPSNIGVVGRYILTPSIFRYLHGLPQSVSGEVSFTDAVAQMIHTEAVLSYQFIGKRYNCGTKLDYLRASVDFGLKHPEVAQEFRHFLQLLALEEDAIETLTTPRVALLP
jgi:UTP--glucose-1-phosphate uridylyltransferase